MHTRICPSILKSSPLFNVKKVLANRPKNVSDKDWNEIVSEEKLNKRIVLNTVPKKSAPSRSSSED